MKAEHDRKTIRKPTAKLELSILENICVKNITFPSQFEFSYASEHIANPLNQWFQPFLYRDPL